MINANCNLIRYFRDIHLIVVSVNDYRRGTF